MRAELPAHAAAGITQRRRRRARLRWASIADISRQLEIYFSRAMPSRELTPRYREARWPARADAVDSIDSYLPRSMKEIVKSSQYHTAPCFISLQPVRRKPMHDKPAKYHSRSGWAERELDEHYYT